MPNVTLPHGWYPGGSQGLQIGSELKTNKCKVNTTFRSHFQSSRRGDRVMLYICNLESEATFVSQLTTVETIYKCCQCSQFVWPNALSLSALHPTPLLLPLPLPSPLLSFRQISTVLGDGLKENFQEVSVKVVECPDHTQTPWNLAVYRYVFGDTEKCVQLHYLKQKFHMRNEQLHHLE